jgi:hypothetical protein
MKQETWVAVDGHGVEYAFNEKPQREFPDIDKRVLWGQRWYIGTSADPYRRRCGVRLPKGTIKFLTGKQLTYLDEPMLVEFDYYGDYVETRPEVLESDCPWPAPYIRRT